MTEPEGEGCAIRSLPAAFSELYAEAGALRKVAFAALRRGEILAPSELAARAGLSLSEQEALLARLSDAGLVRRDARGGVVGIAGLSVEPTAHQLHMGGHDLFTWCALDAVGIPAALRLDSRVLTRCWHCGRPIELVLPQGRIGAGLPHRLWLPPASCTNVFADFCADANLFCDVAHLAQWRAANSDPAGQELDLTDAGEIGRVGWADFTEPATAGELEN